MKGVMFCMLMKGAAPLGVTGQKLPGEKQEQACNQTTTPAQMNPGKFRPRDFYAAPSSHGHHFKGSSIPK